MYTKKKSGSIREIAERTVERIKSLGEDTASLLKVEMRTEAEIILTHVTEVLSRINSSLNHMEEIKNETHEISRETANKKVTEIKNQCNAVLEGTTGDNGRN